MTDAQATVYVALLDEGVDVWRPAFAEHIAGEVYRIAEQRYDAETERWEFIPGDIVRCGTVTTSEGPVLAAKALADDPR